MQADLWRRRMLVLTFATFLVRFLLASFTPPYTDEAYYRCWSLDLKSFYFDHPPMVAWLMAFSRLLLGEGVLGMRLWAPFMTALAGIVVFMAAIDAGSNRRGAFMAAAAFHAVPAVNAAGVVMTPDTPLLLFWTLGWYFGQNALRRNRLYFWPAAGIFCALGILSKLNMLLFIPALILALLFSNSLLFVEGRLPRIMLCIMTALLLPLLLVDMDTLSASFVFQSGRIGASFNPLSTLEYLAGHFVTLSPLMPILLLTAMVRRESFALREYLSEPALWFFAVPFSFFLLLSPFAHIELNWAVCAWLPLFGIVGPALTKLRDASFERLYKKALLVSCVFSICGIIWFAFLDGRISEYGEIRRLLRSEAMVEISEKNLFAQRYQEAALAAFVLRESQCEIKVLPMKKQRRSELDWRNDVELPDKLLLIIRKSVTDIPPALKSHKCEAAASSASLRLLACER